MEESNVHEEGETGPNSGNESPIPSAQKSSRWDKRPEDMLSSKR